MQTKRDTVSEDYQDEFDRYTHEQAVLNVVEDEFEHFIRSAPVNLPPTVSSLGWWLQEANRQSYPALSRMAIDLLSIPPMSAEPERVFAGARRTISWDRFRLEPDNIERIECMKSWIRTGIASAWRAEPATEPSEETPQAPES